MPKIPGCPTASRPILQYASPHAFLAVLTYNCQQCKLRSIIRSTQDRWRLNDEWVSVKTVTAEPLSAKKMFANSQKRTETERMSVLVMMEHSPLFNFWGFCTFCGLRRHRWRASGLLICCWFKILSAWWLWLSFHPFHGLAFTHFPYTEQQWHLFGILLQVIWSFPLFLSSPAPERNMSLWMINVLPHSP